MAEKTLESADRTARELFEKGLAALERNSLDYAIELFRQCLAIEPNFVTARKFLRATQMKNASGSALRRVMTAAKAAPQLTKAKLAIQKNPAEAMNICEQVLTDDPKNSPALLTLAEAAEAGGYPETAILTLDQYLKLNPKDVKTMHWLARIYCSVNQFDAARELYERILQINPNDFEAQKGLKDVTARGAMHGGGWESAKSYRDVIKDKDEARALEQESRVIRAEDMIENLIRENLAKLQQEPGHPVVRRELGRLYAQKGDYETALKYLEELFASEAGSDPSLEREIADIKIKRAETVLAALRKQAEKEPGRAAELQAQIQAREQEIQELRLREAQRLVERYPNDLMYRFDYAVLLMNAGHINEAVEQFQKSVGQPQRRVASLNYLGQCFHQLGLYDLAVEQYLKAIEETPQMDGVKKDLLYNLGLAYEAMGQQDKALAEFKKIAAVDFGFRDVRQKIIRKPTG